LQTETYFTQFSEANMALMLWQARWVKSLLAESRGELGRKKSQLQSLLASARKIWLRVRRHCKSWAFLLLRNFATPENATNLAADKTIHVLPSTQRAGRLGFSAEDSNRNPADPMCSDFGGINRPP